VASQGRGGRRDEGARAVRQAGGARGQAGMALTRKREGSQPERNARSWSEETTLSIYRSRRICIGEEELKLRKI
jgi:hypothetical protein